MSDFYRSNRIREPDLPLTQDQSQIIREYCFLANLSTLSKEQEQRIADILEIAKSDQILDFWLTEADHYIGHKLNLDNENQNKNLQARLTEYLVTDPAKVNRPFIS